MTRCALNRAEPGTPSPASSASPIVSRRGSLLAAVLLSVAAGTALAQPAPGHRVFPANALRGELTIGTAPEVLLNGKPDRLAPGARIRGTNNLVAAPASLSGQRLPVHYTREASSGLLMDVWVLQPVEVANKPWPTTAEEARGWSFDPSSQTWKKR